MKKKLLAAVLSVAMVFTMSIPAAVSADTTIDWNSAAPTEPMAVDQTIVKVGAHAAAKTFVSMLGGNLVADRSTDYGLETANQLTLLGAFGSNYNQNPDPYIWNWWYNQTAGKENPSSDALYMITDRKFASPMAADLSEIEEAGGVSYTIARTPDILANTGYDAQIAKYNENNPDANYDPIQFAYKCSSLPDFCESMYNLAYAMEEIYETTGKTGRYDSEDRSYTPITIAKQYEAFQKGIQLYIYKKIAEGDMEKRDVAIIYPIGVDTNADGVADLYQCYNSSVASGTAASNRGSEYVENTVNNVIDIYGIEKTTVDGTEGYYVTPEQILAMDAVVTGVQATGTGSDKEVPITTESEFKSQIQAATGCEANAVPGILLKDPADIFGIRMNSAENVLGIPLYQGFVYPELINPIYGAMYIYENFWHMKNDGTIIATLAETNFADASLPEGIELSGAGYNSADIDAIINEGISYYRKNTEKFEGTKLELSDDYMKSIAGTKFTVSPSKATYTGKAIKPRVGKVVVNGTELKQGTDFTVSYSKNKAAGTAIVIITGIGDYCGSATATFTINKAAQPMVVKAAAKTVKYAKVKKAKQTVKPVTVTKNQGKVTFKKVSGNKKLTVNASTGKVTVKKKTKKGTYTVKIKATAKGNANYKAGSKTVTVKIKVK